MGKNKMLLQLEEAKKKKRVTIISLIICDGELAKQYVIFKGTAGGRIEADLQEAILRYF